MGEQLLMVWGGGDGWGVMLWGDTVPLWWGDSITLRENPGPVVVPDNPENELKKFGDAEHKQIVSIINKKLTFRYKITWCTVT